MSAAHSHGTGRRLAGAVLLNAAITLIEFVGGLLSGSLALVSDAGHNLSDTLALVLGLAGEKAASRQPTARYSFGLRRLEVIVALANSLSLVAIAIFIAFEAAERFAHPRTIDAPVMLSVAAFGLAGNLFSIMLLHRHRRDSLNLRAAFLHLFYDALSSLAVVAVGVLLLFFPWTWLDLVVSLLIVVMMVWSSLGIITEAMRILLQAAPRGIDPQRVQEAVLALPGIVSLHGLHIWSVSSSEVFLSCHLRVGENADRDQLILNVNRLLAEQFGIEHTALQVECGDICSRAGEEKCCR